MRRHGTVVSAADAQGRAPVSISGVGQCRACEQGRGCGLGLLSSRSSGITVICSGAERCHVGDSVTVSIDQEQDARWLLPVFAAFGLPLSGLLSMVGMAALFCSRLMQAGMPLSAAAQDLITGIAAASGLVGGVFAWRRLSPALFRQAGIGHCQGTARIVCEHDDAPSPVADVGVTVGNARRDDPE